MYMLLGLAIAFYGIFFNQDNQINCMIASALFCIAEEVNTIGHRLKKK